MRMFMYVCECTTPCVILLCVRESHGNVKLCIFSVEFPVHAKLWGVDCSSSLSINLLLHHRSRLLPSLTEPTTFSLRQLLLIQWALCIGNQAP